MLDIAQEGNHHDALDVRYSTKDQPTSSHYGTLNYSVQGGSISAVSALLFILSHLITAFLLHTLKVLQVYI